MSRYLIDKKGDVLPAFDDRLTEKFGYPMPDFDLPSYAVRNLGAVDVDIREAVGVVRFRWLTVTGAALEACARLLLDVSVQQVTIYAHTDDWEEHNFASVNDAIVWLEQTHHSMSDGGARTSPHMVVSQREIKAIADRPLNSLNTPDDHFSFFFKKWRLTQGRFSTDITEALVRFGDIDRSSVARERQDGQIVFEHVGSKITLYSRSDDSWMFRLSGRPVAEQPDREYGRYTENLYRTALDHGKPQFDHVDAVVQDGGNAVRFRYDRLLLPWRGDAGERLLTGLSFKTDPDAPSAVQ